MNNIDIAKKYQTRRPSVDVIHGDCLTSMAQTAATLSVRQIKPPLGAVPTPCGVEE